MSTSATGTPRCEAAGSARRSQVHQARTMAVKWRLAQAMPGDGEPAPRRPRLRARIGLAKWALASHLTDTGGEIGVGAARANHKRTALDVRSRSPRGGHLLASHKVIHIAHTQRAARHNDRAHALRLMRGIRCGLKVRVPNQRASRGSCHRRASISPDGPQCSGEHAVDARAAGGGTCGPGAAS